MGKRVDLEIVKEEVDLLNDVEDFIERLEGHMKSQLTGELYFYNHSEPYSELKTGLLYLKNKINQSIGQKIFDFQQKHKEIRINSNLFFIEESELSYEQICEKAGQPIGASVCFYDGHPDKPSGILVKEQTVRMYDGLRISVYLANNA